MQKIGTRLQVMNKTAKMTGGGLKKKDLKYNKYGKIVSKKMSTRAKKDMRLQQGGRAIMKGGGKFTYKIERFNKDISIASDELHTDTYGTAGQDTYGTAGQDTYAIYNGYRRQNMTVIIVADGHGEYGEHVSRYVVKEIIKKLSETTKENITTPDKQFEIINSVNDSLLRDKSDIALWGGTSLSLVVIKKEPHIRKTNVYLSYIGDSPVYANIDTHIHILGGDDSWDNKEAVGRYIAYCKQKSIVHKNVIYGRINKPGQHSLTNVGIPDPIPVYNYNIETCGVSLIRENYMKLAKIGASVGVQTLEKIPTHKKTIGGVEYDIADEGYEDYGWGNTLDGGLQARTSIGDTRHDTDAPCDPVYKAYTLTGDSIKIAVMSDGWGDLGNKETVMDLLETDGETLTKVSSYIRDNHINRYNGFISTTVDGTPTGFCHDDVTAILVT
jgi:hypothetical protein